MTRDELDKVGRHVQGFIKSSVRKAKSDKFDDFYILDNMIPDIVADAFECIPGMEKNKGE